MLEALDAAGRRRLKISLLFIGMILAVLAAPVVLLFLYGRFFAGEL